MRFRMTNKHQRPIANCARTSKGPKTLISHNCSKTKKVPLLPILLICGYTECRRKRGRVQYTLCLSRLPPPPSGPLALGGRCISIAMPTDHSDTLCIICQSMCTCNSKASLKHTITITKWRNSCEYVLHVFSSLMMIGIIYYNIHICSLCDLHEVCEYVF